MQIYKYSTINNKSIFEKVYSYELPSYLKTQSLAHNIFDIIDTLSQQPPPGCLPLNGYEITKCSGVLPDFFEKFKVLSGTSLTVKSIEEWHDAYANNNGNVGFFGYDEQQDIIKLPCLSTAVQCNLYNNYPNGQYLSRLF